jgi:hypothetical protein
MMDNGMDCDRLDKWESEEPHCTYIYNSFYKFKLIYFYNFFSEPLTHSGNIIYKSTPAKNLSRLQVHMQVEGAYILAQVHAGCTSACTLGKLSVCFRKMA